MQTEFIHKHSFAAINGSPLLTCVVIIDLQGLSMKNFTLSTQKVLSQIFKVDQVSCVLICNCFLWEPGPFLRQIGEA
jgi:hypothetical protein